MPFVKVVYFLTLLLTLPRTADGQTFDGITIREASIPMTDGVRLAADLYMPEGLRPTEKLPVLLEYLPYRKDEGRRNRFGLYAYFVKRGYIVARVDIRGTGNSGGMLIPYEYSDIEQKDGEQVIDWLSKQPFSSGNIGMFGISWGGFNAIHMAMRRPPALKTILALMATDDIYQDDVHFMDGMMHIDAYEIGQDLSNILPGAPDFIVDDNYFRNRFETTPWLLQYKKQQRDGRFWNRASLNSNYNAIQLPVFLIGGWYDGYRDAVLRMMQNMKSPVKGMIGPWNHTFPNWAEPPPAMEWRAEAMRWFDHWLKNKDTGIMEEPRLATFIRDGHEPGTALSEIKGTWRWSQGWPAPQIAEKNFYPGDKTLLEKKSDPFIFKLRYHPSSGPEAGGSVMWWGDWSPDQRPADSLSLVFETEPLKADMEIFGFPRAHMKVSADAPQANWFVRLNDVAPDGKITLVTGAGANGTHRKSAEYPEAIRPGEIFLLDIELHATSWTFRKGHRIRFAINNAQWPMIWPSPKPFTASFHTNESWFSLPVLTGEGLRGPSFLPPEENPTLPGYGAIETGTNSGFAEVSGVVRDPAKDLVTVRLTNRDGTLYPWGKMFSDEEIAHKVSDRDPAKASTESRYTIRAEMGTRHLMWEGILLFESDAKNFYYTYTRRVSENGVLLRTRTWKETIQRDFH